MAWNSGFDPFANVERSLDEIRQRMLAPALGLAPGPLAPAFGLAAWGRERMPSVDVVDEGKVFSITADLPGVNKEEIEVDVGERFLTLRAQSRRDEKQGNRRTGFLRQERAELAYFRTIPLPDEVDAEGVKATYKNGVLHVTVPKAKPEARRGRRVKIE